jgi:hypothetical protein
MSLKLTAAIATVAAVTAFGFTGQASAQTCNSCSSCESMAQSFDYPAGRQACNSGRQRLQHGGRIDELKRKHAHQSELFEKSRARNDAWPKPFACLDKRDYYDIWSVMLDSGVETQCVLNTDFFNTNHELNRVGIDRVAGIMLNMPANQRVVYLHREADANVNDMRLASVTNTIETYYRHLGSVNVKMTDAIPLSVSGSSVQRNLTLREDNLSPAVIDIGEQTSIQQSVQN